MRFLLDTVTASELRRGRKANPAVIGWQAALPPAPVGLSVITLAEIRFGIRKVEKKDPPFAELLEQWYEKLVAASENFQILPVNQSIAEQAAEFRAAHGTPYNDALIAATAAVYHLTLVTRNIADFTPTGISLLDPWEENS